MQLGEAAQRLLALRGELNAHGAPIVLVGAPLEQPAFLATCDERDDAVVFSLHALGELGHRCPVASRITLHLQHQLILEWREPVLTAHLLAVTKETPQLIAKLRKRLVLPFGDGRAL